MANIDLAERAKDAPHFALSGELWSKRTLENYPDSKVHGANMGPIWGRQDPGGSHIGPINFAIWVLLRYFFESVLLIHL